jgi:hypothetical protein
MNKRIWSNRCHGSRLLEFKDATLPWQLLLDRFLDLRSSRIFGFLDVLRNGGGGGGHEAYTMSICRYVPCTSAIDDWRCGVAHLSGVQCAGWLDTDSHESYRHGTEHNRSFYNTKWRNTDWLTDQVITEWMTFSLSEDNTVSIYM